MRYLLPRLESVPLWPTLAAPVFLALFVGLVWWTYRKKRKPIYDEVEKLPFAGDPKTISKNKG